ncbi:MAG TPA: EF-hand domain-containing protein [Polyangiaceae bacterium]
MVDPVRRARSDENLLEILERAFVHHASAGGKIGIEELKRALGLRSEYMARRVLSWFDRDGNGSVSRDEFLSGARSLVFGTDREKLKFAFGLHDDDGDGFIDRQELFRMISISLAESDVAEKASQPPEYLTRVLLAAADRNQDGRISFDEFEAALGKYPDLIRNMTRSEAIWIAPNEELIAWLDERAAERRTLLTRSGERGFGPAIFVAVWAAANVVVLLAALLPALPAAGPGALLMSIGRALGVALNVNGALILIPMMRRLLTKVRSTFLGAIVPVDDAVGFHRLVGHSLFVLAVGHVAAFIGAYALGHPSPLAALFLTERGLSGAVLFGVFAVMWAFSLSFVRRKNRFELFYFTHLLYVAWLGLAIAHAPSFLLFALFPLLGFAVEQGLRLSRRAPESRVTSSQALRSGVTRLAIARPPGFQFAPGDYAFLRIPSVARHEWHPFTISSAPEREDLTFHVRSLGNWTAALRRRVENHEDDPEMTAYVDGPYGSPSAHIFRSKVAVLIGAGIGVTPFASVLESLVLRANGGAFGPSSLRKAHFFWLNRDQYSFEWFGALLRELERIDHAALLDIHLCMTGGRSGGSALGLELARELMHASGRSDLITGLRTHTHMGPPDWDLLLSNIARKHQGEAVDVYFCGPPGLAAKLKPVCARLGMSFREERF